MSGRDFAALAGAGRDALQWIAGVTTCTGGAFREDCLSRFPATPDCWCAHCTAVAALVTFPRAVTVERHAQDDFVPFLHRSGHFDRVAEAAALDAEEGRAQPDTRGMCARATRTAGCCTLPVGHDGPHHDGFDDIDDEDDQ